MYGRGDISTEGNEELVYGGEFLWSANVEGDGAGIKVVLGDIVGVDDVVETLCHFCGKDEGRSEKRERDTHGDRRQERPCVSLRRKKSRRRRGRRCAYCEGEG